VPRVNSVVTLGALVALLGARLGNDYWPIDSPSIKDRITKNRSYR